MKLARRSTSVQVARLVAIAFALCTAAACGGRASEDVVAERFPERGGEVFVRSNNVSAAFWTGLRRATTTHYTESCSVYAWDDCGMQWPPEALDGGRIDIAGTKEPMSLEFASGAASYRSVYSETFLPGDTISIRSSGSVSIPAFRANIVAPAPIRVTQPVWPVWTSNEPEGRPRMRLRAQDGLELRWEATKGSGRVTATVAAAQENPLCSGQRRVLECSFARDDLRATIPASALLAIAAVPGATVQLSVGAETFETVLAPEFPVRITAFKGAATLAPNQSFGRPLSDEAWTLVVFQ